MTKILLARLGQQQSSEPKMTPSTRVNFSDIDFPLRGTFSPPKNITIAYLFRPGRFSFRVRTIRVGNFALIYTICHRWRFSTTTLYAANSGTGSACHSSVLPGRWELFSCAARSRRERISCSSSSLLCFYVCVYMDACCWKGWREAAVGRSVGLSTTQHTRWQGFPIGALLDCNRVGNRY